jgi:dihydropyrimidinase
VTLVVEGGQVVTPEGVVAADVVVAGEQVAGLVAPGRAGDLAGPGTTRLDARGMLVLPGGVDVHTHLDMPLGELRSADSFASGTEAALLGGTTTVVDFCVQPRGQSPLAGLAASGSDGRMSSSNPVAPISRASNGPGAAVQCVLHT